MTTTNADLQIRVESVMQRHPITIQETDTIQNAVEKMTENHLSALPVVDDDDILKGILTVSDMMRLLQDAERTLDSNLAIYDDSCLIIDLIRQCLESDQIVDVMTGRTLTAQQGDSMQSIAKLMIQHQVHHVPVVSTDHRLLGIVSSTDFVRLAADGM